MYNNIPVITQDDFEQEAQPIPRPTMAPPSLVAAVIPKLPEKKLIQKGLWGKQIEMAITKPTTKVTRVQTYWKGSKQVKSHDHIIEPKTNGNKKKASKNINSKKKNGQPKHSTFFKSERWLQGECSIGTLYALPGC